MCFWSLFLLVQFSAMTVSYLSAERVVGGSRLLFYHLIHLLIGNTM